MDGCDNLVDASQHQHRLDMGNIACKIGHSFSKLHTSTDARTDPGHFCSLPVALPDESAWGAGPLMLQLPCTHDDWLNSACKKAMRRLETGHHLSYLTSCSFRRGLQSLHALLTGTVQAKLAASVGLVPCTYSTDCRRRKNTVLHILVRKCMMKSQLDTVRASKGLWGRACINVQSKLRLNQCTRPSDNKSTCKADFAKVQSKAMQEATHPIFLNTSSHWNDLPCPFGPQIPKMRGTLV